MIYWNFFFYESVNNFSALLLRKPNVLDDFNSDDFFRIFTVSRSTEILIESNFCLLMYVSRIINY